MSSGIKDYILVHLVMSHALQPACVWSGNSSLWDSGSMFWMIYYRCWQDFGFTADLMLSEGHCNFSHGFPHCGLRAGSSTVFCHLDFPGHGFLILKYVAPPWERSWHIRSVCVKMVRLHKVACEFTVCELVHTLSLWKSLHPAEGGYLPPWAAGQQVQQLSWEFRLYCNALNCSSRPLVSDKVYLSSTATALFSCSWDSQLFSYLRNWVHCYQCWFVIQNFLSGNNQSNLHMKMSALIPI